MATSPLPPIDLMRQLLLYTPDTGELIWRERSPEMFRMGKRPREAVCNGWNKKFAGKHAFPDLRADGYRYGRLADGQFMAHRVAWAIFHGKEPLGTIDHINGDRSDNRITNLRDCPMAENARNLSLRKDNKFGSAGIYFRSRVRSKKQWFAQIKIEGRATYLGAFETMEEAVAARKAAERKHGFHALCGKPSRGYVRHKSAAVRRYARSGH